MRYAKNTLNGAYQGVIRFFKGRDIADVFEEFSEDALARGLSEGLVDGHAVLRDLRKVEQATGMELLSQGYGIDLAAGEVDTMPLLEAFSKLARAHAWERADGSATGAHGAVDGHAGGDAGGNAAAE